MFEIWKIPENTIEIIIMNGMPIKGFSPMYLLEQSTFRYSIKPMFRHSRFFINKDNIIFNEELMCFSNCEKQAAEIYHDLAYVGQEMYLGKYNFQWARIFRTKKRSLKSYAQNKKRYFEYILSKGPGEQFFPTHEYEMI